MGPYRAIALTLLAAFAQVAAATEITPNTLAFNLTNYLYKDPASADLLSYSAAGFYQRNQPLTAQRIFILPQIKLNRERISFIGKNGLRIKRVEDVSESNLRHVELVLSYSGNLPNREESIGIASQVSGTSLPPFYKFASYEFSPGFGGPGYLDSILSPQDKQTKIALYKQFKDELATRDQLYQRWTATQPQVVAINGLKITALVDGEPVAERTLDSTVISEGDLPVLYLSNLNEYQINRIKENGFEVLVKYTFRDQNTSSIAAHLDFHEIMERVVRESQRRVVSGKSGGYQFLGFGSRKSTMKQAITESLSDQLTTGRTANTVIQMDDADDEMIDTFNSKFFPVIQKDKLVEEHMKAAERATTEGKADLARAHMLFAQDVNNDKPDLSVDTEKAMAALNKDDYVGFIAHGLKIGSSTNKGSFEYARVVTAKAESTTTEDWTYSKNMSVNRAVTKLIQVNLQERKPYVGLCDAVTVTMNLPELQSNGYVQLKQRNYFVPTCLTEGGAFMRAGLVPGLLVQHINGTVVTSINQLEEALDAAPGEVIPVVYMEQVPGPMGPVYRERRVVVKLGAGDLRK
jgi:hypothetical protein